MRGPPSWRQLRLEKKLQRTAASGKVFAGWFVSNSIAERTMMSGVFLSYSRGDRAIAEQTVHGLRAVGVEAWWDDDMPGVQWQAELERQIKELAAVVVLWTENSVNSENVRDEARLGLSTNKLVNALWGVPEPPFPFDRVNGLPLDGWTGREPHHGWSRLVQTIEALVVRTGGAQPGDITSALGRRDQDLRDKQEALTQSQAAFEYAQTTEAEADEAAKVASAALVRAEDDLGRVGELRVSPTILRTAQQELDTMRTAKEEADRAHRAARAQLGETSRALARAKADLDKLFSEVALLIPPAGPAAPLRSSAVDLPTSPGFALDVEPRALPKAPPGPSPERAREPNLANKRPAQLARIPLSSSEAAERSSVSGEASPSLLARASMSRWIAIAAVAGVIVIGAVVLFHRPSSSPSTAISSAVPPLVVATASSASSSTTASSSIAASAVGPRVAARTTNSASIPNRNVSPPLRVAATSSARPAQTATAVLSPTPPTTVAANPASPAPKDAIADKFGDSALQFKNYPIAMMWYRVAAGHGDAYAEYSIGDLYSNGQGVVQNTTEARAWMTKAAAGGNTAAEAWLAQHPQ